MRDPMEVHLHHASIFLNAFSALEQDQASVAVYVSSEDTLRRGPLVSELSKSGM